MTDGTVQGAVLNQIAQDIHTTALNKGFWDPPNPFLAEINLKLLLIVSECIEAHNVLRNHYEGVTNPYTQTTDEQLSDFLEEIADIVIRAFDTAQYFEGVGGPLGEIVLAKMAKNSACAHKHGRRF